MVNHFKEMAKMQDEVNELTTENWKDAGHKWSRPLWLEAAEAVESTDFKWWKDSRDDIVNIKIELVDMWHFALSMVILDYKYDDSLYESHNIMIEQIFNQAFEPVSKDIHKERRITSLETIAAAALTNKPSMNILKLIARSAKFYGMSYDEFVKMYVGKAVLNKFRQDNGYKEKTYIKMWGESEDNIAMVLKINDMELDDRFASNLTSTLEVCYEDIKRLQ